MSAVVAHYASASAVIPNGAVNSSAVPIGEYVAGSFQFPAAMTGTSVNVQVSNDGANWTDADDAAVTGGTLTYTKVNNEVREIDPETFRYKFLRFVSQAAEGAERTIAVFLKGHK